MYSYLVAAGVALGIEAEILFFFRKDWSGKPAPFCFKKGERPNEFKFI